MIKICVAWTHSRFQGAWDYVFSAFDLVADDIYIIPIRNQLPERSRLVGNAHIIRSAEGLPTLPLVVMAPMKANHYRGSLRLDRFKHPKDCIYLFGADDFSLHSEQLGKRAVDEFVYIPFPGHLEVNAHIAAGIVLYDRMVK